MMERVYVINVSGVANWSIPRSFVNMMMAYLAEKISNARDVGLGSVMAGRRRVPALTIQTVGAESASITSASGRTRPASANETLARFQRDIVPQLDAAYNFARFL